MLVRLHRTPGYVGSETETQFPFLTGGVSVLGNQLTDSSRANRSNGCSLFSAALLVTASQI